MDPKELSRELREETGPTMRSRRQIISLSMLGGAMGQIVSLYQTGIIKHLPDPPGTEGLFDADRVDASNYAYSRLDSPDGFLMVINYGITAWLAGAGGKDRARRNPLLPIAMGAKILMDCVISAELAREEWAENKAFCEYCQVATVASLASLVIAWPEVKVAIQTLMGKETDSVAEKS